MHSSHEAKVQKLQQEIEKKALLKKPIGIHLSKHSSNVTRSKNYKTNSPSIQLSPLNEVLKVDPFKKIAWIESQVSMDQLVKATLPFGLMPPVVPEFKGITVGGAIMGAAAESSSHRYGTFHDTCVSLELILGNGEKKWVSKEQFPELFYGVSGSYGSLAYLVSAKIELVDAPQSVHLTYTPLKEPLKAVDSLIEKREKKDVIEALVLSKNCALIIEGNYENKPSSHHDTKWFAHQARDIALNGKIVEESVPIYDYLFRYDNGAFWMGSYLFNPIFMTRYLLQGILKWWKPKTSYFDEYEISRLGINYPRRWTCFFTKPFTSSQFLWSLLHKASKWIQERLIIQDCCIPSDQAARFLAKLLHEPFTFPLWICPLKGTLTPQVFAPHQGSDFLINFGLYGVPATPFPMKKHMEKLEKLTREMGGRKVLYSCSFYTEEEFWSIYPKESYITLREEMHAENVFHDITTKVLSQ